MPCLHVTPTNDLIEHDTSRDGDSCICGPRVEPVKTDSGSVNWLITHHSLDGREFQEVE